MALSLSVTIQRSFRMAEQHGAIADGLRFPRCQRSWRNFTGIYPSGGAKYRWVG